MIVVDELASTLTNLMVDAAGTAKAGWQSYTADDPVRVLSGVPYMTDSSSEVEDEEVDENNTEETEAESSSSYQSLDIFFPTDFISPVVDNDSNNNNKDNTGDNDDDEETTTINNNNKKIALLKPRPVYVFIHGGGWSRGSKDNYLYGAPSMCKNMCMKFGCISVSVGYRLGNYPKFMIDAAYGIKWIQNNITSLGGNMNQMFLSGHSAGGHISSLLMIKYDKFLEPLGIRRDLFKGIALVSGVYDLFCPMKKALIDAKNKTFVLAYVIPAFGYNNKLRHQASPLLLLDPSIKSKSILGTIPKALYKQVSETYRWSISTTSILPRLSSVFGSGDFSVGSNCSTTRSSSSGKLDNESNHGQSNSSNNNRGSSEFESIQETSTNDEDKETTIAVSNPTMNEPTTDKNAEKKEGYEEEKVQQESTTQEGGDSSSSPDDDDDGNDDDDDDDSSNDDIVIRTDLPPTILLNAWFDMGLEENGKLMKQALESYDVQVKHEIIPATDHASICWNQTTVDKITEFFQEILKSSPTTSQQDNDDDNNNGTIMARGIVTSNDNVVLDE